MFPQKLFVWIAPDLVTFEGTETVLAKREYKDVLGSAMEIAVKMPPEVWAGTDVSANVFTVSKTFFRSSKNRYSCTHTVH